MKGFWYLENGWKNMRKLRDNLFGMPNVDNNGHMRVKVDADRRG